MSKSSRGVVSILAILLWLPVGALAQKSKIPVLRSISPTSTYAPGSGFTLTVTGSNFTGGSVVQWNGGTRTTTVVGSTQLQAQISSADVATAGTARVTVFTSGRFGGTCFSALTFTINPAPTPSTASTTSTTTSTTTTSTPPTTTTTTSTTAALAVTTTAVPGGTSGASYPTTPLAASGGSPAYTWSVPAGGGNLPPGLALTAAGAISGTPSAAGKFSFTAQATDTAGQVAQKAFSMAVAASTTGYLFQDDFEGGTLSKWGYVAAPGNFGTTPSTTSVLPSAGLPTVDVTTGSLKNSNAMHLHFDNCGVSTNTTCGAASQDIGQFVTTYFNSTNNYPDGLSDVYVSAHVMWHVNAGGTGNTVQRKVLYLKDPGATAPYNQGYNWAVVLRDGIGTYDWTVLVSGGAYNPCGVANGAVGGPTGEVSYNGLGSWAWDTWSWVQLYVHANTPGSSDGALSLWVDGNQVLNQTGLNLRGTCTTGLSRFGVGFQTNRYNYNVVDEEWYLDNVAISNAYINW